jgi:hypothetical protein
MALTDAQIDRYSRQIIVPRVGGRGQERLLAARILIAGDARDIEEPLAYLVGAGIGTIGVKSSEGQVAFSEANPDVSINTAEETPGDVDLALVIVGSEAARKIADAIARNRDVRSLVIARVDSPGRIAVIIPRATSGLDASMLAAVGARSEAAGFIALLAAAEAFKLLAGYDENPCAAIIEFEGYETVIRAYS